MPRLAKRDLDELRMRTSPWAPHRLQDQHPREWPAHVAVHNIVLSLRSASPDQVDAALNLARGDRPGQYVREENTDLSAVVGGRAQVGFRATVNLLDGVKSVPELRAALRDLIADVVVPGRR